MLAMTIETFAEIILAAALGLALLCVLISNLWLIGKFICRRCSKPVLGPADLYRIEVAVGDKDKDLYIDQLKQIYETDTPFDMLLHYARTLGEIKRHYEERGHTRCWMSDIDMYHKTLYKTDPDIQILALPPRDEWLGNCANYCLEYWEKRQPSACKTLKASQNKVTKETA